MHTGTIPDDKTLKIHTTSDGSVWFLDGGKMPESSGLVGQEFLSTEICRSAKNVRLVGTSDNAMLLLRFMTRRRKGEIHSVEVASPLVGSSPGERANPEIMLTRMRSCQLPASLGGWHEFGWLDHPSYALAQSRRTGSLVSLDELVNHHPVWPYVSFNPHINKLKLASLLGLIIDPRWYVNLQHPNSLGYLEAYLGLNPATMMSIHGMGRLTPASVKCGLVRDTWLTKPPSTAELREPGYFLWRKWLRRRDDPKKTPVDCDLRISQSFIAFIRYAWLDAIYAARRRDGRSSLFVPEYYFHSEPDTVEAFRAHKAWMLSKPAF